MAGGSDCLTWNYLLCFLIGSLSIEAVREDYCSDEVFQASCSQNQVIVMEEAKYGRMQLGKCVKSELGFLGCQVDALSRMDEKCSGKQRCETVITDAEFTVSNPCSEELKMYLQADYSCLRVMPRSDICTSDGIIRLEETSHVMSSRQLASSPCFSSGQQWSRKIQASTGQQINVTLLDFENGITVTSRACVEYGHVTDAHTKQSASICSHGDRQRTLLISNSNILALSIKSTGANMANFALKMEVLGCPDIKVAGNSWVDRNGDSLTVGCHNSKQTWNLNCVDNRWQGSLGNCSVGGPNIVAAKSSNNVGQDHTGTSLSTDIAISLIACVAILICVVVIALGVNCWKRHSLKTYTIRMHQQALQHALQSAENPESDYMMPNYLQKDTGDEGVDALYDFCYMPSTTKQNPRTNTRPNNLNSMQTMPVRDKINNSTAVRFQTHSPKLMLRSDHKV